MMKKVSLAFYALLLIAAGIVLGQRSGNVPTQNPRDTALGNLCYRRGAGPPVTPGLEVTLDGFARLHCQRGSFIADWVQFSQ
jgi:hypothetical protein